MLIYSDCFGTSCSFTHQFRPYADATAPGGSFALLSMCRRGVSRVFRAALPFEVLTENTVGLRCIMCCGRLFLLFGLACVSGLLFAGTRHVGS